MTVIPTPTAFHGTRSFQFPAQFDNASRGLWVVSKGGPNRLNRFTTSALPRGRRRPHRSELRQIGNGDLFYLQIEVRVGDAHCSSVPEMMCHQTLTGFRVVLVSEDFLPVLHRQIEKALGREESSPTKGLKSARSLLIDEIHANALLHS